MPNKKRARAVRNSQRSDHVPATMRGMMEGCAVKKGAFG
jgi:hypothetical protein